MSNEIIKELEQAKDIQGLMNALKDSDSIMRLWAVLALGRIGDEEVVPALRTALEDPYSYDPSDVYRGDRNFEEMGDSEPIYPVRGAARDALEMIHRRYPDLAIKAQEDPPKTEKVLLTSADEGAPFHVGDMVEQYRRLIGLDFLDGAGMEYNGAKLKVLSIGPKDVTLQLVIGLVTEFIHKDDTCTMVKHEPGAVLTLHNSTFYDDLFSGRLPYQEILDTFRKL